MVAGVQALSAHVAVVALADEPVVVAGVPGIRLHEELVPAEAL